MNCKDIILYISNFLEPLDIVKCQRINLLFNSIYNDENLWKNITKNTCEELEGILSNRELFKINYLLNALKKSINFTGSIKDLYQAKKLYLNHLDLKSIPRELEYLNNLTDLDLSSNGIQIISKNIKNLKKLKILNLYNNQIKEIPFEIICLENLQNLYLSANELQTIPSEIFNLKNLHCLDLEDNKIRKLEFDNQIKNIKYLWLKNNLIEEIPENINYFTAISVVDLTNNPIKTISKEINEQIKLKLFNIKN